MNMKFGILIFTIVVLSVAAVSWVPTASQDKVEETVSSFYEIDVVNIEGKKTSLSEYRDHVVMFVNTASKCGYTPQYEGLQTIYEKYKDRGFVILGFPANNFGGQEPGSNEEIKDFCTLRYKVSFPMFAKISVVGDDQHLLYRYLTSKETNPKYGGEITWNFNKFLANHKGEMIARFSSKETPESNSVLEAIEGALEAREAAESEEVKETR